MISIEYHQNTLRIHSDWRVLLVIVSFYSDQKWRVHHVISKLYGFENWGLHLFINEMEESEKRWFTIESKKKGLVIPSLFLLVQNSTIFYKISLFVSREFHSAPRSSGAGAGSVGVTVGSPVDSGVSACLQLTINVTAIANIKVSIMIRIFFIEKSPPFNQLSKKSLFYIPYLWIT